MTIVNKLCFGLVCLVGLGINLSAAKAANMTATLSTAGRTAFKAAGGTTTHKLTQEEFKQAEPKIQDVLDRLVQHGTIGGGQPIIPVAKPDLSGQEQISAEQFILYFRAMAYEEDQLVQIARERNVSRIQAEQIRAEQMQAALINSETARASAAAERDRDRDHDREQHSEHPDRTDVVYVPVPTVPKPRWPKTNPVIYPVKPQILTAGTDVKPNPPSKQGSQVIPATFNTPRPSATFNSRPEQAPTRPSSRDDRVGKDSGNGPGASRPTDTKDGRSKSGK